MSLISLYAMEPLVCGCVPYAEDGYPADSFTPCREHYIAALEHRLTVLEQEMARVRASSDAQPGSHVSITKAEFDLHMSR